MKKNKGRNSNIELLRIISMFLIVCHHYTVHGAIDFNILSLSTNKLILQALSFGGKLGVNLFVLISGYFLIEQKNDIKKAIILWLDVSIYSICILLIFIPFQGDIGIKTIIKSILPIPFNTYWFVTTYFVILLLCKYLNTFIKSLDKTNLDELIIISTIILSALPTLKISSFSNSTLIINNTCWFILLYFIAARIRLYPPKKLIFKHSLFIGCSTFIIGICIGSIFSILGERIPFFFYNSTHFTSMESTLMLICSVFLFIGFLHIDIGCNKTINTISATTFGIYLIHDNSFVRTLLWKNIFNNNSYLNSKLLVLHAIFAIVTTFVCCSIISWIYNLTFSKAVRRIVIKYGETWCSKTRSANKKIARFLLRD